MLLIALKFSSIQKWVGYTRNSDPINHVVREGVSYMRDPSLKRESPLIKVTRSFVEDSLKVSFRIKIKLESGVTKVDSVHMSFNIPYLRSWHEGYDSLSTSDILVEHSSHQTSVKTCYELRVIHVGWRKSYFALGKKGEHGTCRSTLSRTRYQLQTFML